MPLRYRSTVSRPAAVALALLFCTSCEARDQRGTLARVSGATLRVGVVENPPWTTWPTGGGAGGIEGALAAEVARDLGAQIEWVRAPESHLLEALSFHELDLVIGGLTDAAPWKSRITFTGPYYTDTVVIAAPPGTVSLRPRLDGRTVAIRLADPAIGAFVRALGGVPQPMPDIGRAIGLVAAPTWQLPRLGYAPAGITLRQTRHVMAVPPGEDAWRAFVEGSLAKRTAIIAGVLRMARP
ncbi:MAG: transporter substrate-binding domain-containing protein [Gemmatimonadota bacterium]|nr:transporter substrate-binding domain-containing protein [Gemmatimonadota bacterium]